MGKKVNSFLWEDNVLKLCVKKASIFVRIPLYLITLLSFCLPILGIYLNMIAGNGVKIGHVFLLGIFCLIGFFMLRTSLWNTFGQEIISFNDKQVEYIADYGWFTDSKQTLVNDSIYFYIKNVEGADYGVLVISNRKDEIQTVTKLNIEVGVDMINTILKPKLQPGRSMIAKGRAKRVNAYLALRPKEARGK